MHAMPHAPPTSPLHLNRAYIAFCGFAVPTSLFYLFALRHLYILHTTYIPRINIYYQLPLPVPRRDDLREGLPPEHKALRVDVLRHVFIVLRLVLVERVRN